MQLFERWAERYLAKKGTGTGKRSKLINLAGLVGIAANLLFAAIKLVIGFASNSVAIISDAVNNLTDAFSSVITIVGLTLSRRKPDRRHPLGYGRIEYLAGMIITVLVAVTGFEFLKTSMERIKNPQATNFLTIQFVILGIVIVGKWLLSKFAITVGKKTNSSSLVAAGSDAKMDVLASILTVIAAIVSKLTGWHIDGYVGVALSIFILYTAFGLIRETISSIIGERPDKDLADKIKAEAMKHDPIVGAYDLILHNYGPEVVLGSMNLEIPDYITVDKAYAAMSAAQKAIMGNHEIYLTFGLYSVNTYDKDVIQMRENVHKIATDLPGVIDLHNFSYDNAQKILRFDIIVDFSVKDFSAIRSTITDKVQEKYPDSDTQITLDLDYS